MIAISYVIQAGNLHAHLYRIILTIQRPSANQIVSLPVWIPGSYLVREFSKNLQGLRAIQGSRSAKLTQLDKCTWQTDCNADQSLVLTYDVYAFDHSVRAAWLDARRGFFNGTSLCLRVHGQEDLPHTVTLSDSNLPEAWRVATALTPQKVSKRGFGCYLASNYDELVDSPVELGAFWHGEFVASGIPHRFIVTGSPPGFDGGRLLDDAKAICEAEIRFWHGRRAKQAPHKTYLFMLNAVTEGYGGLEHRQSTALICNRSDLPRTGQHGTSDGYTKLLGLISHEYFHTWNVKRLRPVEFAKYNYAQENYTDLLWFFEGFTSYYDDLLLRRAGLIDSVHYLKLLSRTINAVLQTPGRHLQSVARASFDAWVKYYRQDENTSNATISYYTKGSLIALCLDLTLRQSGKSSLDEVMRRLWQRCKAGPMTQADVSTVLFDLTGQSFDSVMQQWVHGTKDLPLKRLLENQGIGYELDKVSTADQLGLRLNERNGIHVKGVARGSAGELAGFAAEDEWLGMRLSDDPPGECWRLGRIDDLALYLGVARKFTAVVARDQRILDLPVSLSKPVHMVKLVIQNKASCDAWLTAK